MTDRRHLRLRIQKLFGKAFSNDKNWHFQNIFEFLKKEAESLEVNFFVGERPKRQFIEFNVQHSGLKCFFSVQLGPGTCWLFVLLVFKNFVVILGKIWRWHCTHADPFWALKNNIFAQRLTRIFDVFEQKNKKSYYIKRQLLMSQ